MQEGMSSSNFCGVNNGGINQKTSKNSVKNGKHIFFLLNKGFTVIQIDNMLDIRPVTVEKRCMEYLKSLENCDKEIQFLLENDLGLDKLKILKRFLKSNLDEKNFCKRESIDIGVFRNILSLFSGIEYIDNLLVEKKQRTNVKINISKSPHNIKCRKGRGNKIRCHNVLRLA